MADWYGATRQHSNDPPACGGHLRWGSPRARPPQDRGYGQAYSRVARWPQDVRAEDRRATVIGIDGVGDQTIPGTTSHTAIVVPRARRTRPCARQVTSCNRNLLLHGRVRAIHAAMHEATGQEQGTRNGVDWRGNRRIDVRTTCSDRRIHGDCPNRHARWETMDPLQTTETSGLLRKRLPADPATDRSPGCRTKPPPPRPNRRSGGQTFRPVADQ